MKIYKNDACKWTVLEISLGSPFAIDNCYSNSHPFIKRDESGRTWVLVHNGTTFDALKLNHLRAEQEGDTDRKRILLYLIEQINRHLEESQTFDANDRFELVNRLVQDLSAGNKLNLMIYDSDYFYVHKNQEGTLYYKEDNGAVVFSTRPLDIYEWKEVPSNQLHIYKDGELIYTGTKHDNTYVFDEEQFKLHFIDYSGL